MNQSTIVSTVIRGIRLSVAAALLALIASLLMITQPARAATYVVTNSNNSGPGSLRQAIDDANDNPGADTITFTNTTDGIPIILDGAADEDGNASGDLDILNGGDLAIQGNGAANTIIDGDGTDRVFHICPGGSCTNTITLSGVTISNGSAEHGGGIYNEGGTTTVDGSTVSANTAANVGGGIYNKATLNVQNSSTISANTASYHGGGIHNEGGTTTVDGSTVSTNTAYYGGAIYNSDGTTTVDGSTVSANTAVGGGGIFSQLGGTTTVKDSTVSANTASHYGGGIYNNPTSTTTVDGSTVSANTVSYYYGGGIYNRGTLNVQNGSTIGGAGVGNTAVNGGGIYIEEGATTVKDSTVSANIATNGGGIFNYDGTTTVTGSRILNNSAASNGGGVYNDSSTGGATSVTGCCIVGNSAMSYLNKQPAQQIAKLNWWGAATGPSTPGADTVDGNVDVSGYLTAPILGCAPDLLVGKANDTGGNGTIGTPFHWTLTVSNTGIFSATFGDSQTILIDDLPTGPTYGTPVTGSFVDVANSGNIQCSLAGNTLACAAAGGDVTLEPLSGSFEVTFSVTPSTPETLVNPAGICQVDPDGHVTEGDESNNDCPVNVVNVRDLPYHLYLPVVLT